MSGDSRRALEALCGLPGRDLEPMSRPSCTLRTGRAKKPSTISFYSSEKQTKTSDHRRVRGEASICSLLRPSHSLFCLSRPATHP